MLITLTAVKNPRKEGKWGKIDIEYTRDGGKPSKRTLVAVGETKGVIEVLRQDGAVGKTFDVKMVQSDDGKFWNWVGIEEAAAPAAATKTYAAKGNYETPEERAKRHVSICRQNALTNAVAYLAAKEGKATPDDVINLAKQFASWTTGLDDALEDLANEATVKEKEDFDDDIPF